MPPSTSVPLRNVALVAHVDHGKTTLVDALLRATGTFSDHAAVVDRIMDSNDQERERGITILAKAASVTWNDVQINLVDTPGHSDFGGEVERALSMVDGVILLVDAAEGPLPQTRYVLSKALALGLPTVVVVNKVDRQDARPEEVLDEIYQLFMDLDADENSIEFPVISAIARDGRAVSGIGMPGEDDDLTPLFQAIVDTIPAPTGDPDAPLQAIVTNLDASEYLGRLAIGRVMQGTLRRGEQVALCEEDEGQNPLRRKLTQLMSFSGIGRLEVDAIRAGDLFIVAGFPEVEIGDTLADSVNPVALPRLTVDEPVLRMTFGVNTSPLAGKEGQFLTSRHLRDRLNKEILGNVSIKVEPTESPDIIEVSGRGELQLAVLIETMRREGYELQVSRPEVIVKDIDGTRHEPLERAVIDVPDEHVGTVTQALAPRKGRVTDLRPGDTGRTIVTVEAPARGLIGFRSQLLTATRGTALMHQHNAGWVAWVGDLPTRKGGAMISDRQGTSTGYAIGNLQERGEMFIGSSVAVYEGMIVGENSRSDDMMINIVREKQKTNIRTHSADEAIKIVPPREVTLENAIEFIGDDELVEVTPQSLRLRKRILKESDRRRTNKK
ncbi:MAG: translational GTPase TypA [Actinobacteria bacterium]|nr:translational GTPase TypA [Actinomycetota bacterium]